MGFAKYMQFYSKCFCLGARYKLRMCSGNTNAPLLVGTTINTTATSYVNPIDPIQNGLTVFDYIDESPDKILLTNGIDVAKFVDKPQILNDPEWYCTSSANPNQLILVHWWVHNPSASTVYYYYTIEIEFDCVFTDPIPFS